MTLSRLSAYSLQSSGNVIIDILFIFKRNVKYVQCVLFLLNCLDILIPIVICSLLGPLIMFLLVYCPYIHSEDLLQISTKGPKL